MVRSAKSFDINVLALVKGTERYVWLYYDGERAAMLRSLERMAADPGISLTEYDATVLQQKMGAKTGHSEERRWRT